MLIDTWSVGLTSSFQGLWLGVIGFVPNLLIAIIIFVLGWLVGSVIGKWIAQLINSLKVDDALESIGVGELMTRAGSRLNAGGFIGALVKWFIIVLFLVASLDVLQLHQVNVFLQMVLGYLPNVIVAALMLIIAAMIAEAMQRIVTGSARAAGIHGAGFAGGVTRWAVWVFAILLALQQLGIGGPFAQTILTGVVAMLALAGGLAFGLGGRDAAARYIERLRADINNHRG
ncbi:MAG: hypothetical protein HYT48_03165 [Candidatus Vogelbacteria bacterium]|nr:hypothetical protein [Candidatus Vogelbacteria bacterium]